MMSDALARAFHLLDQDMLGYLDAVEQLTDEHESDDATVLAVARTEVPRLIAALRGTLGAHQPDAVGRCLGCAPTPWPCQVIDAAHAYLKDPDSVYAR
ncbi:MAG: hypothetical protein HOV94_14955 [Saccharothrix sp.]|nr:hypothetical protein [Saccharothrix sp.]